MNNTASVIPEGLKKVPPFPPVAAKLLAVLQKPNVDATEVADLIASDPAFTLRLLQHANSSANALGSAITDIRQAVTFLGFDRTRQITVMSAASRYAALAPRNVDLQKCWEHSLATAILADEIAKSCGGASAKTAFTAAILHDIGRLGLMVVFPREYSKAIHHRTKSDVDLLEFERGEFGIDHTEAGRLLAETWKLPEAFQVVAGRHHDRCEGVELTVLRVVHTACRLADALGFGILPPLADADRNAADRSPSGIKALLDTLPTGACACLSSNPEELRAHIEDRIHKFL
jgi:putative nucleotidyltransferase with HDIG domain